MSILDRRFRGFRLLDLIALAVLLVLAFAVYAFKTDAGTESADSAEVERQIVAQQKAVRLLSAELAHLEDPERIERLSSAYLGMGPVQPRQEIALGDLPRVAASPAPAAKAQP